VKNRSQASDDAILAKRNRIARLVSLGQRVGYGLFGVAIVGFGLGFATEFGEDLVTIIMGSMIVGSLILAPAIVFGYAVKAAERDDREHGRPLS
jgi:hypothetical protein